MPRWVDLSAHGLALKVRKQDDLRWLVLEAQPGAGAVPAEAASQLGFELHDGVYQREGTKITLSEVQRVFPRADVREFEVDKLRATPLTPVLEPAARAAPWWETSIGDQYDAVYLIGASRGKENLTLSAEGGGYLACASLAGVRRERIGTIPEILHWLQTDVLVGMGDAFAGKVLSLEDVHARLRRVKGDDLLHEPQGPAPAAPIAKAAVLDHEASRARSSAAQGPSRDNSSMAVEEVISTAAALSLPRFMQQARAFHDGVRWHATLDGRPLYMPPGMEALSARKRPETILASVHAAQVRHLVEHNPYDCTSFAALVSYPALAFPGALARGRMAEINVMRMLGRLGIADKLMEADSGYCVLANPPYMDLVVERHGFGAPTNTLYLTHYFDQNGERVMDAEMVFAIDRGRLRLKETATISFRGGELRGLDRAFANVFSRNLLQQGFDEATVTWPHDDGRRLATREDEPNTALTPH